MNDAFLGRGRTAATVIQTAPPAASDPSSGARGMRPGVVGEFTSGFSDAMRGRVSLIFLNTIVVAMLGFYLWTRRAQGGG